MKIDAIQGALVAFNYTPGKVPLQGALGLPYLPIPNHEVQLKVHEAFYDYPPVSEELAQWNTRVLVPNPTPQYELMGSGTRSDARRERKECVSTGRSRWSPFS